MDTDDLSKEAYEAIIQASDGFHKDLTLHFGCMATYCDDDNEYLNIVEETIKGWIIAFRNDFDFLIEEIFLNSPPKAEDFKNMLHQILENIERVKNIPLSDRHF